jgi:hypothetical protein
VAALKKFPWWSIVGGTLGLLGNVFAVALWMWAVFSTRPYTDARYLMEAWATGALAVATFFLAFPCAVVGVAREEKLGLAAIIFLLSLSPFPVGFAVFYILTSLRHITLAP